MLQLEAKSQGEPNTVCVQVIVAPVQVAIILPVKVDLLLLILPVLV